MLTLGGADDELVDLEGVESNMDHSEGTDEIFGAFPCNATQTRCHYPMESPKRKRARLACQPCRERKRKCDGRGPPCSTCSQWGYECSYQVRQSSSSSSQTLASPRPPNVIAGPQPLHFDVVTPATIKTTEAAASVHDGLRRRVEANSGATTVRRLGLKMDPNRAPRLNLFGWNIGARQLSSSIPVSTPLLVTEITSLDHMKALAHVYFDKLDPCYGFIDKQQFFDRLHSRWTSEPESSVYDSVLAGVAALGCLFSQRSCTVTELHLVQSARSTLDQHIFSTSASLDLLTGWLLRTIHLRLTDSPACYLDSEQHLDAPHRSLGSSFGIGHESGFHVELPS
ncbi:hypothetical protein PG993_004472 [Apiospora rasikravindrae]|uniref:Zn(2)-C6 fungal-type domain-containing protein n=1 Tax=Apiospora rasikravindrae TaxID=990691 RepID=A0ABR1TFL0_9PEZI